MIDIKSLITGAAAGWASSKATQKIDEAVTPVLDPADPYNHSTDDYIRDIHYVLVELAAWLKEQAIKQEDIFEHVTLSKSGYGSPFKPNATQGRQNIQLFSPVAATLNVNASGLLPFNLSLPAADWKDINLPDGTTYILDASYTSNSLVVYMRNTGQSTV